MRDVKGLVSCLEATAAAHNATAAPPLPVALCPFIAHHVARVRRTLRVPGSHALVLGAAGSGRRSVARLAAAASGLPVHSLNVTQNSKRAEWRLELKAALQAAGVEGTECVLLLSDVQVANEALLEDVTALVSSGDVPNLFAGDERAQVCKAHGSASELEREALQCL